MGVYLITNKVNSKKYVGMSNNIRRRFAEHTCNYNIENKTTVLARSFRKYGVDNFEFQILEIVNNIEELTEREQYWIKELQTEYNMNEGGHGNSGYACSDETKDILRLAGKLQWERMPYHKKQNQIKNNLKGRRTGYVMSKESRDKVSVKNTGNKHPESAKRAIGEKNKVSMLGNKNGNKQVSATLKDGTVVVTFDSVAKAAKHFNIQPTRISGVLNGRRNKTQGFYWKYGK